MQIVAPSQPKEKHHEAYDHRSIAGRRLCLPEHYGSKRRCMRSRRVPGRLRRSRRSRSRRTSRRPSYCSRTERRRRPPQSVLIVVWHFRRHLGDNARQDVCAVTSKFSEALRIFGDFESAGALLLHGAFVTPLIHWIFSIERAVPPHWPASCDVRREVTRRDLTEEHTR